MVLIALVILAAPARADFETGEAAYDRGDYATAFQEFRPLAEQGHAEAQFNLGFMRSIGQGVPQDDAHAVLWYRKAAEQGHAMAQSSLGFMYYTGQGVPWDDSQAAKWFREAAEQGDAPAQLLLGLMYKVGWGVPRDDKLGKKWSDKAAEQGLHNLVPGISDTQVEKRYRKAAEQGFVSAQFYFGLMWDRNYGVTLDRVRAARWYRKAAEQGHAGAQYELGWKYERNVGVAGDHAEAVKWYRKAADQGHAMAQYSLGSMYYEGRGVKDYVQGPGVEQDYEVRVVQQDYSQAAKWFRKAAEQGFVDGQFQLGMMYLEGQGMPQDNVQALEWFNLAAEQGHINALEFRKVLVEGSTAAQTPKTQPEPFVPERASVPRFPSSPVAVRFPRGTRRADDIAVIIGNADYQKGKDIPNVIPAYADAASIKNYVTQALGIREDNIIYLKDAGQSELTATFGSATNPKGQLFNYVKPGKSRIFVYYSGHGAPGGEDGSSYIVPTDAQASLIDLNGYPLKTLYKNLSKIPARSVTVVLEACFSGASQSGSIITQASPIYLKAKETIIPSNITVIAAGAANQIASWEQDSSSGLFTKYFLKGMSGEADAKPYGNTNGKVGYDELGRYFKETITYYARRYYGREQTAQIIVGSGG